MRPVNVDRGQVLDILKQNRAQHRKIFDEAVKGYRKEVIRQLKAHIREMESGKPKRTYISIPLPEDHTQDYDDAIGLLELTEDVLIEMDVETYKSFYKDDWTWKRQFLASNSGYSQTAYTLYNAIDDD